MDRNSGRRQNLDCRFTLPRRSSDCLPRRSLAKRRATGATSQQGRGVGSLIALRTSLDVPDEVGGDRPRPSGLAADRRYTSSSRFSDRAALHTFQPVAAHVTAAQE